jgi:hypothetical protein
VTESVRWQYVIFSAGAAAAPTTPIAPQTNATTAKATAMRRVIGITPDFGPRVTEFLDKGVGERFTRNGAKAKIARRPRGKAR